MVRIYKDMQEVLLTYNILKRVVKKHKLQFILGANRNDLSYEDEGFVALWNPTEQKFWVYFGMNCSCYSGTGVEDSGHTKEKSFDKVDKIEDVVRLTKFAFNINNSNFKILKNEFVDEMFIRNNYRKQKNV